MCLWSHVSGLCGVFCSFRLLLAFSLRLLMRYSSQHAPLICTNLQLLLHCEHSAPSVRLKYHLTPGFPKGCSPSQQLPPGPGLETRSLDLRPCSSSCTSSPVLVFGCQAQPQVLRHGLGSWTWGLVPVLGPQAWFWFWGLRPVPGPGLEAQSRFF